MDRMAKPAPSKVHPPAFCFHQSFAPAPLSTRSFERDYLMYAMEGAIRLQVDDRCWILPPSFAAWIPMKTEIQFEMPQPITACSVLFVPGFVPDMLEKTTVFPMPSHARSLVTFSRQWGPDGKGYDAHAEAIFRAIAITCVEHAQNPSSIWCPVAHTSQLRRAITFMQANLSDDITLAQVAGESGLSERTLLRRCSDELRMTWAQCLRQLRMIRAVENLSQESEQIVQVALASGYSSLSAFNKAFKSFTNLTPSEFRARFRANAKER
jgi:AraC-like DNA-binding protein